MTPILSNDAFYFHKYSIKLTILEYKLIELILLD
jgi:hypothetical protein